PEETHPEPLVEVVRIDAFAVVAQARTREAGGVELRGKSTARHVVVERDDPVVLHLAPFGRGCIVYRDRLQARIEGEKRPRLRRSNPGQADIGKMRGERRNERSRAHDIAKSAGLDDRDFHGQSARRRMWSTDSPMRRQSYLDAT